MSDTSPSPRQVVCLGSAVLDRVRDGGAARDLAGGAALNVAVGIQRLGVSTTLLGVVSDDPAGRALTELLDTEGVQVLDAGGGRATSVVESRRTGGTVDYRFSSEVPSGLLALGEEHLGIVADAPVVVMSAMRVGNGPVLDRLVETLGSAAGYRLYDPNPRVRGDDDLDAHRREVLALSAVCDLVKLAREDIELLFPEPAPDVVASMLDRGVRAVLVTDGPLGASLTTAGFSLSVDAAIRSEDVVDPMGAGDATIAATAVSLLATGWPQTDLAWVPVLNAAMRAAALACRAIGGAASMPSASMMHIEHVAGSMATSAADGAP
ncbi:MAG: fructokinase [Actinomycetota bacterium]|jgi:fructokinase|nr:fructokinase [Actinomycetota bacterium]